MADEQEWSLYTDQATLADTDTILARTSAGAGFEIPGSALLKKDGAGNFVVSADFRIGDTANPFGTKLHVYAPLNAFDAISDSSSSFTTIIWNKGTSGNNLFMEIATEAGYTPRGSISYNRAGGLVAFNTTSDYRSKDIIGPLVGAGKIIDALTVYEGMMKGAEQSRPMFIAHEAQAVAPYTVTGEKDAVDKNGNPIFQQIDVSSLVPLLVAEIQELRRRVSALEAISD